MLVKLNDRLVFSSVQYQIRSVVINKEILQKSRLVIDVNEKVTVLDEVVVGPENTEKFLDLKEEEFKRTYYNFDKSYISKNKLKSIKEFYFSPAELTNIFYYSDNKNEFINTLIQKSKSI